MTGDELIAELNFENALRQREEAQRKYVHLMVLKHLYSMPKLDNLDLWIEAKEARN